MKTAKRPAHGVRDNRSPMQASARARSIGRCAPHDFAPGGRNKNVAFAYPHGEQSVTPKCTINYNYDLMQIRSLSTNHLIYFNKPSTYTFLRVMFLK